VKTDDFLPQLATLVDSPPEGEEWIHEAKFDGYRTIAIKDGEKITLYTRNGNNWTAKYAQLAEELKNVPADKAVLDGEIVALDEKGIPDFNKLQNQLDKATAKRKASGLVFYLFDILSLNGKDLRKSPLSLRKEKLKSLFKKKFSKYILFSDHFETDDVQKVYKQMCSMGLEGVVSKKKDAWYYGGRNKEWLKTKCVKSDEFIVIGYRRGTDHEIGSLLLGMYEGKELKFAGKVGTGFSKKTKDKLWEKFKDNISPKAVIKEKLEYENIVWLKPKLVAEIEYLERTKENLIRHGSFQRLRDDKEAKEVTGSIELPKSEFRTELFDYYDKASKLILPYLKSRPLNLYICHGGIKGNCYFYRRSEKGDLKDVKTILKPNGHYIMTISNKAGLKSILSMGTVEIHSWQTKSEHIENPDQVVLDIDASPGVSLEKIRLCASRIKTLLDDLDLKSFIKTSGGKGYHIHIPVAPIYSWEQIKNFSEIISRKMEQDYPREYTSSVSPERRKKKIYIDYLRNARGTTAVVPYSVRAKEAMTIAVPIAWKDLNKYAPDSFTIHDLPKLLKRKDPWMGLSKLRQKIKLLEAPS
jgi:bifunctional non-homologous end joining protein LigD